ncbi:MAG: reverse transcriptase/maturase family protein, partial [Actinobacteria bacterium]|nr:reverse transcriptase/maturase family protein [Actinomycetota bacterium]
NRGADWVLTADVQDAFGNLDHAALMEEGSKRVCDRQMLKLIRAWLRAGVLQDQGVTDLPSGTPQGSPISPLLFNVALHRLDQQWQLSSRNLGTLIRFADDWLILCRTPRSRRGPPVGHGNPWDPGASAEPRQDQGGLPHQG